MRKTNNDIQRKENEERISKIVSALPTGKSLQIKQTRDKGASAWLNALPIEEMGFRLNKEEFRDALRLNNIQLKDLPSTCSCGRPFIVSDALICNIFTPKT